jgi:hypothetical protein
MLKYEPASPKKFPNAFNLHKLKWLKTFQKNFFDKNFSPPKISLKTAQKLKLFENYQKTIPIN